MNWWVCTAIAMRSVSEGLLLRDASKAPVLPKSPYKHRCQLKKTETLELSTQLAGSSTGIGSRNDQSLPPALIHSFYETKGDSRIFQVSAFPGIWGFVYLPSCMDLLLPFEGSIPIGRKPPYDKYQHARVTLSPFGFSVGLANKQGNSFSIGKWHFYLTLASRKAARFNCANLGHLEKYMFCLGWLNYLSPERWGDTEQQRNMRDKKKIYFPSHVTLDIFQAVFES